MTTEQKNHTMTKVTLRKIMVEMREQQQIINAPWTLESPIAEERLQIRDSSGRRIAVIAGTYPTGRKTEDKHAHLICAAPDMYNALKNLLSRVANDADSCTWFCDEQEAAIKALSKARGEHDFSEQAQ